jgi:hypothetical protein
MLERKRICLLKVTNFDSWFKILFILLQLLLNLTWLRHPRRLSVSLVSLVHQSLSCGPLTLFYCKLWHPIAVCEIFKFSYRYISSIFFICTMVVLNCFVMCVCVCVCVCMGGFCNVRVS